ncbi:neurofilament light polypeptide-like [Coffea eugenioides]|uniref:GCK domain-containing protein n=1 Tax=Coffea arabica TaxID=13443 RepID=A0ABM4WBI9_COFAR|nr:neurofilament light polypeptide-like [Coffea eugenioides]
MGGNLSTTSSENPSSPTTSATTATKTASAAMPPSVSPPTHNSKPLSEATHDHTPREANTAVEESSDPPSENQSEDLELKKDDAVPEGEVEGGGEEEEEEGECGFCLFMKGGGCKDVFIEWEKCVEEGEAKNEDIVDKCAEITGNLKRCMEAHADYYGPLLLAEKAAQEEARKELEKDKEKETEKGNEESASVENSDKDGALGVSEQKIEEKDGVSGDSERKSKEKDGALSVPGQKSDEKDWVSGISQQKSEEKDGVLGGSEEKKDQGS